MENDKIEINTQEPIQSEVQTPADKPEQVQPQVSPDNIDKSINDQLNPYNMAFATMNYNVDLFRHSQIGKEILSKNTTGYLSYIDTIRNTGDPIIVKAMDSIVNMNEKHDDKMAFNMTTEFLQNKEYVKGLYQYLTSGEVDPNEVVGVVSDLYNTENNPIIKNVVSKSIIDPDNDAKFNEYYKHITKDSKELEDNIKKEFNNLSRLEKRYKLDFTKNKEIINELTNTNKERNNVIKRLNELHNKLKNTPTQNISKGDLEEYNNSINKANELNKKMLELKDLYFTTFDQTIAPIKSKEIKIETNIKNVPIHQQLADTANKAKKAANKLQNISNQILTDPNYTKLPQEIKNKHEPKLKNIEETIRKESKAVNDSIQILQQQEEKAKRGEPVDNSLIDKAINVINDNLNKFSKWVSDWYKSINDEVVEKNVSLKGNEDLNNLLKSVYAYEIIEGIVRHIKSTEEMSPFVAAISSGAFKEQGDIAEMITGIEKAYRNEEIKKRFSILSFLTKAENNVIRKIVNLVSQNKTDEVITLMNSLNEKDKVLIKEYISDVYKILYLSGLTDLDIAGIDPKSRLGQIRAYELATSTQDIDVTYTEDTIKRIERLKQWLDTGKKQYENNIYKLIGSVEPFSYKQFDNPDIFGNRFSAFYGNLTNPDYLIIDVNPLFFRDHFDVKKDKNINIREDIYLKGTNQTVDEFKIIDQMMRSYLRAEFKDKEKEMIEKWNNAYILANSGNEEQIEKGKRMKKEIYDEVKKAIDRAILFAFKSVSQIASQEEQKNLQYGLEHAPVIDKLRNLFGQIGLQTSGFFLANIPFIEPAQEKGRELIMKAPYAYFIGDEDWETAENIASGFSSIAGVALEMAAEFATASVALNVIGKAIKMSKLGNFSITVLRPGTDYFMLYEEMAFGGATNKLARFTSAAKTVDKGLLNRLSSFASTKLWHLDHLVYKTLWPLQGTTEYILKSGGKIKMETAFLQSLYRDYMVFEFIIREAKTEGDFAVEEAKRKYDALIEYYGVNENGEPNIPERLKGLREYYYNKEQVLNKIRGNVQTANIVVIYGVNNVLGNSIMNLISGKLGPSLRVSKTLNYVKPNAFKRAGKYILGTMTTNLAETGQEILQEFAAKYGQLSFNIVDGTHADDNLSVWDKWWLSVRETPYQDLWTVSYSSFFGMLLNNMITGGAHFIYRNTLRDLISKGELNEERFIDQLSKAIVGMSYGIKSFDKKEQTNIDFNKDKRSRNLFKFSLEVNDEIIEPTDGLVKMLRDSGRLTIANEMDYNRIGEFIKGLHETGTLNDFIRILEQHAKAIHEQKFKSDEEALNFLTSMFLDFTNSDLKEVGKIIEQIKDHYDKVNNQQTSMVQIANDIKQMYLDNLSKTVNKMITYKATYYRTVMQLLEKHGLKSDFNDVAFMSEDEIKIKLISLELEKNKSFNEIQKVVNKIKADIDTIEKQISNNKVSQNDINAYKQKIDDLNLLKDILEILRNVPDEKIKTRYKKEIDDLMSRNFTLSDGTTINKIYKNIINPVINNNKKYSDYVNKLAAFYLIQRLAHTRGLSAIAYQNALNRYDEVKRLFSDAMLVNSDGVAFSFYDLLLNPEKTQELKGEYDKIINILQIQLNQILNNYSTIIGKKIEEFKKELDSIKETSSTTKKELDSLKDESNYVEKELVSVEKEFDLIKKEFDFVEKELNSIEKKAENKEKQTLSDEEQQISTEKELDSKEKQEQSEEKQPTSLKAKTDSVKSKLDSIRKQLASVKNQLDTIKDQPSVTKNQVSSLKNELDSLKNEFVSAGKEFVSIKNELENIKKQTESLEKQHTELDTKNEEINKKIQELSSLKRAIDSGVDIEQKYIINQIVKRLKENGFHVHLLLEKIIAADVKDSIKKFDNIMSLHESLISYKLLSKLDKESEEKLKYVLVTIDLVNTFNNAVKTIKEANAEKKLNERELDVLLIQPYQHIVQYLKIKANSLVDKDIDVEELEQVFNIMRNFMLGVLDSLKGLETKEKTNAEIEEEINKKIIDATKAMIGVVFDIKENDQIVGFNKKDLQELLNQLLQEEKNDALSKIVNMLISKLKESKEYTLLEFIKEIQNKNENNKTIIKNFINVLTDAGIVLHRNEGGTLVKVDQSDEKELEKFVENISKGIKMIDEMNDVYMEYLILNRQSAAMQNNFSNAMASRSNSLYQIFLNEFTTINNFYMLQFEELDKVRDFFENRFATIINKYISDEENKTITRRIRQINYDLKKRFNIQENTKDENDVFTKKKKEIVDTINRNKLKVRTSGKYSGNIHKDLMDVLNKKKSGKLSKEQRKINNQKIRILYTLAFNNFKVLPISNNDFKELADVFRSIIIDLHNHIGDEGMFIDYINKLYEISLELEANDTEYKHLSNQLREIKNNISQYIKKYANKGLDGIAEFETFINTRETQETPLSPEMMALHHILWNSVNLFLSSYNKTEIDNRENVKHFAKNASRIIFTFDDVKKQLDFWANPQKYSIQVVQQQTSKEESISQTVNEKQLEEAINKTIGLALKARLNSIKFYINFKDNIHIQKNFVDKIKKEIDESFKEIYDVLSLYNLPENSSILQQYKQLEEELKNAINELYNIAEEFEAQKAKEQTIIEQTDQEQTDQEQTVQVQTDSGLVDQVQTEQTQTIETQTEPTQTVQKQPEQPQADQHQTVQTQTDQVQDIRPQTDQVQIDQDQVDQTQIEQPQIEQSQTEQPKTEQVQTDQTQTEHTQTIQEQTNQSQTGQKQIDQDQQVQYQTDQVLITQEQPEQIKTKETQTEQTQIEQHQTEQIQTVQNTIEKEKQPKIQISNVQITKKISEMKEYVIKVYAKIIYKKFIPKPDMIKYKIKAINDDIDSHVKIKEKKKKAKELVSELEKIINKLNELGTDIDSNTEGKLNDLHSYLKGVINKPNIPEQTIEEIEKRVSELVEMKKSAKQDKPSEQPTVVEQKETAIQDKPTEHPATIEQKETDKQDKPDEQDTNIEQKETIIDDDYLVYKQSNDIDKKINETDDFIFVSMDEDRSTIDYDTVYKYLMAIINIFNSSGRTVVFEFPIERVPIKDYREWLGFLHKIQALDERDQKVFVLVNSKHIKDVSGLGISYQHLSQKKVYIVHTNIEAQHEDDTQLGTETIAKAAGFQFNENTTVIKLKKNKQGEIDKPTEITNNQNYFIIVSDNEISQEESEQIKQDVFSIFSNMLGIENKEDINNILNESINVTEWRIIAKAFLSNYKDKAEDEKKSFAETFFNLTVNLVKPDFKYESTTNEKEKLLEDIYNISGVKGKIEFEEFKELHNKFGPTAIEFIKKCKN